MTVKGGIPVSARQLLRAQAGAISSGQALACGMSRRAIAAAVADGHWQRAARGVFLTGHDVSWLGRVWAGVLACERGVVGGASAAHLWGLASEPALPITLYAPVPPRMAPQPWWTYRRGIRRSRGEPPRTTIEDTLLDQWGEVRDEEVIAQIGAAVTLRRTTVARLSAAAGARPRIPRRRDLVDVLGETRDGVRSPLERDYRRLVERAHGLPTGVRQASVSQGAFSDVAYPEWGLLVELDGRRGHDGVGAFRDMARDNRHLVHGFATLRYGFADVRHRPCHVADQVAAVLASRGWAGAPVRCSRCRLAA